MRLACGLYVFNQVRSRRGEAFVDGLFPKEAKLRSGTHSGSSNRGASVSPASSCSTAAGREAAVSV